MTTLTKTSRILHRNRVTADWINFRSVDEDGMTHTAILLDVESYRDMGEPEVVTVTIVPGDHLNGDA